MTFVERLILENQILQNDGMSQFQVYRDNGNTYTLYGIYKSNSGNCYTLYSPIPSNYPDGRPKVYIQAPNPLYGYGYKRTINSYGKNGISHDMHTLSNGPNGEVQICHWRDDRWHRGITLNKVMLKVMIWIEAYEQHLSSGQTISSFIRTMPKRLEV